MTTRFSADTLDLSRFPAPLAIRGVSFETIQAERMARLPVLLTAFGIPFDAGSLEAEPVGILQQADAYREMLVLSAINDAVRSVMVAFAIGADLEHLGAFYGVTRRIIALATSIAPAVMESDEELRRRLLLAPEAFAAAGPHGAYVFHALSSDPRVLNADVWSDAPGVVNVAVQSRLGSGVPTTDLVEAVRAHLNRRDVKPLTDVVNVRPVVNVPYRIEVDGFVLPGPDREAVKAAMLDALTAMAASRRTPSRDVPRSAVFAAASVGPLDKAVVIEPATDIARGYGEVADLTGIIARVTTYDE